MTAFFVRMYLDARLADNSQWYIDKMSNLLGSHGNFSPADCCQQLITVIQRGMFDMSLQCDRFWLIRHFFLVYKLDTKLFRFLMVTSC
jgi:hypothetical protein